MTSLTELKQTIRKSRPGIRETSLNLYANNANKLAKLYHKDSAPIASLQFLKDTSTVTEIISQKKPNTQKTYLASIVVVLMAFDGDQELIKHYRTLMEQIANDQNLVSKKQLKSESQVANWSTVKELRAELNRQRKAIVKRKLWTKSQLTAKEFEMIQKYVVGSLYLADDANPPLRSDYGGMKLICGKDYGALPDGDRKRNYLVIRSRNRKLFHLGDYKTAKTYGEKQIKVGSTLNTILNKWLKVNKHGTLLVNKIKKPMTPNQLTKYMPKVFEATGKKIGISLLRHIYISEKFPAQLQEKEATADLMAHSVKTQADYSKK